ncbi:biotin--[acetyl-CoA-carboxylase] ligase [Candidatus Babeliales bacterium]|nr:biotin--[acetyl-CoA-carboxylase] ligase [Candidatus Babeliales bacterium]
MIGCKVYHTSICQQSSMDWAKEKLSEAPDGALFLADFYETARGRQGRIWELYQGQLILTFILKPVFELSDDMTTPLNYLNMALTVGVAQVLDKFGVVVKWPNDFVAAFANSMAGRAGKKIGGILLEAVWHGDKLCGVIVGLAINVNNTFEKGDKLFTIATSLKRVSGKQVSLELLQEQIISSLNKWYNLFKQQNFEEIYNAWRQRQVCLGQEMTVHRKDGTQVSGVAKDVCVNGDLVLLSPDQHEQMISFSVVESVLIDFK